MTLVGGAPYAAVVASSIAPYGTWPSAIAATDVAAIGARTTQAAYVGDEIWWSASIAAENRVAVMRAGEPAGVVLPAPWSARSRVHEYGGGAWAATAEGRLVFVEATDQRVYALRPGGTPVALTPEAPDTRYGGLRESGGDVLAIRERRVGDRPVDVERDLVRIRVDGPTGGDAVDPVRVVAGSHFLAQPTVSPDGRRLAWIAWEHPSMPWESTELRVGDLRDGRVDSWRTVLGGPGESVLQPEWLADGTLVCISDRTGWWNLVEPTVDGAARPLLPQARETGGALWDLGQRWYLPLPDGRLLITVTLGADEQGVLDPATGTYQRVRSGRSRTAMQDSNPTHALFVDDAADEQGGLRELDLATGAIRTVQPPSGLDESLFPAAELHTFDGVHAIVYPPRNPDWTAPAGESPPFVATVHGGPTAHAAPRRSASVAYYTSRGIGVVDINYGGSTGYGRAYRERLDGQWGVVDVQDVLTVMRGLAAAGIADPARLSIEGGSAGGWTVLGALLAGEPFACGVSSYGVADAVLLALDTHDFEARYLDGLIGPYPEAAAVYAERAPITRASELRRPVLLMQGLDDRVVPPEQSQRFRDALVAAGIAHAYLEFPGEGHGFRQQATIVAATEAALSFTGQILGFAPPGVPVLPLWRPDGKSAAGDPVDEHDVRTQGAP